MSFRNFLDELKKGLPSNYVLASSDSFLHSEAVSMIKNLIPPAERDFNLHFFDLLSSGSEAVAFEEIIDVLNTAPFFTGRKFVIVDSFQKILKKDIEKLQRYLENPSESSIMIALHAGTLKKTVREHLGAAKHIILDIRETEIPLWLKSKAKSKGFLLSDGAADYLLGTIGPDLGMLSSELDKCTLIDKSPVEKGDIIAIVEGKRKYGAFDLVNALRAKNAEKVFTVYKILSETEEPFSLLGALNWQYSQYFSKSTALRDSEYFRDVFDSLNKADIQIKSSGGYYPLELLLMRLLKISRQR